MPVEGRIDMPLLRYTGARGERSVPAARDDKEGQRAVTDFRTLDNAGQKLAWLELSPITGRTHQLRLHMSGLGLPIVGDDLYPRQLDTPLDDFTRPLQLLAARLEFDDPVTGVHRRLITRLALSPGDHARSGVHT